MAHEASAIERQEDYEDCRDRDNPDVPHILEHPEERNSFQVTEEQRRVSDRRERAPDIANDKNKKYHMKTLHPVLIRREKRTDQDHRRSGCSQHVRCHRADGQQHRVRSWRRFAPGTDMNPARDDEKRADEGYEPEVVAPRFEDPRGIMKNQEVITDRNRTEAEADEGILPLPPTPIDERHQGDCSQQ